MNDFERIGFLLCRNEENNELIYENRNESVERIPFNIKGMRKRIEIRFKRNFNNMKR